MSRVFRSLSRSSSSISLGSNSVSSSSSSPKNKEIVTIENIEKYLNNWDIPKVGVSSVYNKGTFVFKSDYIIKTVEEALPESEAAEISEEKICDDSGNKETEES